MSPRDQQLIELMEPGDVIEVERELAPHRSNKQWFKMLFAAPGTRQLYLTHNNGVVDLKTIYELAPRGAIVTLYLNHEG